MLRNLCVAAVGFVVVSLTSSAIAAYAPSFQWVRSTDWAPGTINNSSVGNPNNDSQGNPTWYYERSQGGNLASANPWYSQPRSLQIWRSGVQQWRAGTSDEAPAQSSFSMGQDDVDSTFASPVTRWQNPTGSSQLVNISVGTAIVSERLDANSEDLELAIVELSGGTYNVLWSLTKNAPDNGVVQGGSPVTLSNISVGAGDALLFTYRNKLDTPLSGNGSTGWFVSLRPTPSFH